MTIGLVSPKSAHALGPVDIEAAAQVGYGSNPSKIGAVRGDPRSGVDSGVDGIANALGPMLGGRLGASFFEIYTGVKLDYYLGASGTIGTVASGAGGNIYGTAHTLTFGAELGYSIRLIRLLTVRPQLGFGNADRQLDVVSTSFDAPNPTISDDTNYFYLEPGITSLLGFGHFFVGADTNLFLLPTDKSAHAALTVHGQVGVKL